MKKDILKIAGVKSEKEFYKKFPTKEAFMAKHGGAFKKAAMGKSMVKKQLTQLTDFANPPQAQVGAYIGGDQTGFNPVDFNKIYDNVDYSVTGSNRKMRMDQANLAAQQQQAAGSNKKGFDLGNMMQSIGDIAQMADGLEYGGNVPKAQVGADLLKQFGLNTASYRKGQIQSPTGQVTKAQTEALGFKSDGSNWNSNKLKLGFENFGKDIGAGYDKLDSSLGNIGGVQGAIGVGTDLAKGFQQLKQEKEEKKQAKQFNQLSGVVAQAAATRPEQTKRRYVRPEDNLVNPGDIAPSYGTGTNFLAKDGMQIGGNLTEIQNMYNPGDIYSDMGYEPLGESDVVKQYKRGGEIEKAQLGFASKAAGNIGGSLGSLIGGNKGRPTAGGQIGSTIGSTVGNLIVPGLGGIVGGAIGGIAGGIFGGKSARQTSDWQEQGQQNMMNAAMQQGVQGIQSQNSAFMEDGGWVSHDWQPQVIAKFGDYDVKDLFAPDPTMDTLRTGGSIRNNYMSDDEQMSMMQMGGELQTHWGGDAEPISYNPYLPDGGETVMFRGQSHGESDGQGRTGIGITYGNNPVEVERGEPAVKLQDGGSEESLVVFGDMKIPSYGVSELGDDKAKGMKFKHYGKHLSKLENKQNNIINKSTKLVDSIDDDSPFDLLKLNSGKAGMIGADMKLKDLAMKKQTLANVQNAILDTADEYGLESSELAQGKIKKAKFGAKMETAQWGFRSNTPPWQSPEPLPFFRGPGYGITPPPPTVNTKTSASKSSSSKSSSSKSSAKEAPTKVSSESVSLLRNPSDNLYDAFTKRWDKYVQPQAPKITSPYRSAEAEKRSTEAVKKAGEEKASSSSASSSASGKKDKFDLNSLLDMASPYLRPMINNPLDPSQLYPEAFALATNQLEPVQAQTFQPMLEQMPSVSFQDQLNEIQADVNASKRLVGNNPAALAMIDAQAAASKNKVLGEQFRTNQMMQAEARRRNIGMLNDATLKNLAILDQQYQRQAAAKSATKAQAFSALSSIADKIGKNKAETLEANVMANMYPQYTFGRKGRIFNTGITTFNIPDNVGVEDLTDSQKNTVKNLYEKIVTKSGTGEIKDIKEKQRTTSRNGSIVKALKNF